MREIQIFLASSIVEFETERLVIHNYIQSLERLRRKKENISLILKKCENMDSRLVPEGKQNVYNAEICKSNIVLFLFGSMAGDYTLEELTIAAENLNRGQISILCREDPYKSDEPSLKALADIMDKYRLPYSKYYNIDSVKAAVLEKLFEII